jgi:hypothetical protein
MRGTTNTPFGDEGVMTKDSRIKVKAGYFWRLERLRVIPVELCALAEIDLLFAR